MNTVELTVKNNLKQIIIDKVFMRGFDSSRPERFIFDFRKVTMDGDFIDKYFEMFKIVTCNFHEFQIGGIETSSIPLLSGLALKFHQEGKKVNTFFIRKSKKKYDLFKEVEGNLNDLPIILVDDLMNSGKSFVKQIETLEHMGKKVSSIFPIVNFRNLQEYSFFTDKGIQICNLFDLNDFSKELGIKNFIPEEVEKPLNFNELWAKQYGPANYAWVVRKGGMCVLGDRIYFTSDFGALLCINSNNGDILWQYNIKYSSAKDRKILSTPVIYKDRIYFGAYDGNFYCLDKDTGKVVWINYDADWIGSSPAVSIKHSSVYVGLEFGLFYKKGGIACLDVTSGKVRWRDSHEGLTHSSPFVLDSKNLVFCGSNDGVVRVYDSVKGTKLKDFNVGAEVRASFNTNKDNTLVAFGSFAKKVHIIDIAKMDIVKEILVDEVIYSNPVFEENFIYVSCLDKKLYKFDHLTGEKTWEFDTGGRSFADPVIIGDCVYIGSNSGCLFKLNKASGKSLGYLQFIERIVSTPYYNKDEHNMLVLTFGNSLHKISGEFLN